LPAASGRATDYVEAVVDAVGDRRELEALAHDTAEEVGRQKAVVAAEQKTRGHEQLSGTRPFADERGDEPGGGLRHQERACDLLPRRPAAAGR
jgi:hypothetical protein